MQTAIIQSVIAIIGMQGSVFINEIEWDAPLHPLKMFLMGIMITISMLDYYVNMFFLLFKYKAYLTVVLLLIGYRTLEVLFDKYIHKFHKKTGRVIYIDDIAGQSIKRHNKGFWDSIIVEKFGKPEKER